MLAARVGHGVTAAVEASLGTVRQGHAHANAAWRVTLRHEPIGADVARRVASTAKVVLPTSRTTPRGHRSGASDDVTAIDRSGVRGGRRDDHGLHDQRPEQQRTALASGGSGGDRWSGRGSRANVHSVVPAAGSPADARRRRGASSAAPDRGARMHAPTPARRASRTPNGTDRAFPATTRTYPACSDLTERGIDTAEPQHDSPEDAKQRVIPVPGSNVRAIWRDQGGIDAEAQELVDGNPRAGAAGSARSNAVIARERFSSNARGERAPPSQASAWSGPAAGIEE